MTNAAHPNLKDFLMTDIPIRHAKLLTQLRQIVGEAANFEAGDESEVEVAATALADMLAVVLARIPGGATAERVGPIVAAIESRLTRQMAIEAHNLAGRLDLSTSATGEANHV